MSNLHSATQPNRRKAIRLANANATIWAFGNGLTSTALISSLALELGAGFGGIAWIIAAPKLVGILRIAAPQLIQVFGNRRWFCVLCYLVSALVLGILPPLCLPGLLPSRQASLIALIVCWSVYHLFQYLGTVALWDWYADLFPPKIRGRFIGTRQRWLSAGQLIGLLMAGSINHWFRQSYPVAERWEIYCYLAVVGAILMIVAIDPLIWMPDFSRLKPKATSWYDFLSPLTQPNMRRLMIYGLCFSTANGLSSSLMFLYLYKTLGFTLILLLGIPALMRFGQSAVSPAIGRYVDQHGCKNIMIAAQVAVAFGPLLFVFGTAGVVMAYVVWISYAVLNICLPTIILNYSDSQHSANNVAGYFAVTGVAFGIAAILGGYLSNYFVPGDFRTTPSSFTLYFVFAWVLRTLCVIPLCFLLKPNQASRTSP
ncbi:MAG: hypothetical protein COA78_12540 [Blastopirellula sp.]|nr:MAG: hypothetical protein COA78_12540 [Blastopirellula sp.]